MMENAVMTKDQSMDYYWVLNHVVFKIKLSKWTNWFEPNSFFEENP